MTTGIVTKNLYKKYSDKTVIEDLNLSVTAGSVYGFLGPNGAGKTTTVRLLNGLLQPSSGTILVGGHEGNHAAAVRQFCGVQTDTNLYEALTVRENIALWGELYGLPPHTLKQRTDSLIERFALSDRQNQYAGELSKGLKQKVLIARALIHEPAILFLDEPTAGLDPDASQDLLAFLSDYVRQAKHTVFLCSHRLEEVEALAQEIGIIYKGKLLLQGKLASLTQKLWPYHRYTITFLEGGDPQLVRSLPGIQSLQVEDKTMRLELNHAEVIANVIHELDVHGSRIRSVTEHKPSLADIYFATVPKGEL